jgi:hypothetical protein
MGAACSPTCHSTQHPATRYVMQGITACLPHAAHIRCWRVSHEHHTKSYICCWFVISSVYHLATRLDSVLLPPCPQLLAMEPARLLRYVTPLLLSDNEEAVVEAARAFGNFSRAAEARQYLVSARVLEALVLLLDHSSAEVLYRQVVLSNGVLGSQGQHEQHWH